MKGEIAEILKISQVTDYLFLSGYASISRKKLEDLGITCILNMTKERENFYLESQEIELLKFPAQDIDSENLSKYFNVCADKIEEVRQKGGKTLVHCQVGRSRSATICIVYFMKYQNMTLREAYLLVKSKRNIIWPNSGFWEQMIRYEQQNTTKSSVEMVPCPDGFVPDVYEEELNQRSWLEGDDLHKICLVLLLMASWTFFYTYYGDWWNGY